MILPFLGFAQTKRTGKVVDETAQRSLPGVSVVVKGTGNGTVTDDDGNFSIVVADSDTLVFSFIGYQTYKQRVGSTTNFSIALREDATALDEVVVVLTPGSLLC